MKTTLLAILSVAVLSVAAFGQAGENLPTFPGKILMTAGAPAAGTNEIQELTFGATITSGTFKLSFESRNSAAITWSATNATLVANIDAALEALPNIGTGGVTTAVGTIVAGVAGTVVVTFTGNRAKEDVATLVVSDESLVGAASTLTAATSTPGVTADGRIAIKGALLIDAGTPDLYINDGTPPNPTWTKVSP